MSAPRRLSIGAEVQLEGGVDFRIWAPDRNALSIVLADGDGSRRSVPLVCEDLGYFRGVVSDIAAGQLYHVSLGRESGDGLYPDPASRYQPHGPAGPSQVIDPRSFPWADDDWHGVEMPGQVVYEMHVGTFTHEGTWAAAEEQLAELHHLGITLIEVMPVAEFPGKFGWGYDGVNLFAPTHLYGTPDDFRRFVNRAHQLRIGVLLDVVYNHFGPDDNYLPMFAEDYASKRHTTDWGKAVNFDGENSAEVRNFYLANVAYWIDEYHLDGLRIDATQNIYDDSLEHILMAITRTARRAAGDRKVLLIAENEPQDTRLIRPLDQGGYGLDSLWNDDFHHSAMVRVSGRSEAYYTDYFGRAQEFVSAAKRGFLYQGQWYQWQKKRRGSTTRGIPPYQLVTFIQNHDQLANSAHGHRCHTFSNPGTYRAITALWLLSPQTPMFFQGQEFASSKPFLYFADHRDDIAQMVREGRNRFLTQFRSIDSPEILAWLPNPADPDTMERCRLDFSERTSHEQTYAMHRDLLRLRRDAPVLRRAQFEGSIDGAVLNDDAFVLRYFAEDREENDLLLAVNFGIDLHFDPAPEPLLAPPAGHRWEELWSSEDTAYGGYGTAPLDTDENWRIPGYAAVLLRLAPAAKPYHIRTRE